MTPHDPIEELLLTVLELPPGERDAEVERYCVRHPDRAPELRARYDLFRSLTGPRERELRGDGERFGEFELLERLGGGGMGVVYRARQRTAYLDREVALKIVRHGLFSAEAQQRFRREAQAALRLDHPAICPVLDVGDVDGTPWIAMRLVPGGTLAERITTARETGARLLGSASTTGSRGAIGSATRAYARLRHGDVAALIETVARALHAAHQAGLIHRDVKPGNIMVMPDGDPVLVDFGLVLDVSEDDGDRLTISGQPLGTPAYMSPEQVSGQAGSVDHATDVYSLGAVLYECLTLRPPFSASTRERLYLKILREEPVDPRRFDPTVPKDLVAVVATAMSKEPARRYRSAQAFAEDLQRILALQPVEARVAGPLRRARLWCRRNPVVAAVLVLLLISQVLLVYQYQVADQARDRAEYNFGEARKAIGKLASTAKLDLENVPGMDAVRQDLLGSALAFYEVYLARATEAADLREEAAWASLEQGSVLKALAKGSDAKTWLERAAAGYAELVADDPASVEARGQLARAHLELAALAMEAGAAEVSRQHLQAAAEAVEPVAEATSAMVGLTGSVWLELGGMHGGVGDAMAAIESLETALGYLERAIEGSPDARHLPPMLARCLVQLGLQRGGIGEFAVADRHMTRVTQLLEAAPHPSVAFRSLTAVAWAKRGEIALRRGEREDARELFQIAQAIQAALLRDHPAMHRERRNLATTMRSLAGVAEDPAERARLIEEHERVLIDLVEAHPDFVEYRVDLANYYAAGARASQGDSDAAVRNLERGLEVLEPALAKAGAMLSVERVHVRLLNSLGSILWNSGEHDRGNELLDRALALRRLRAEQSPEDLRNRYGLVIAYVNLAARRRESDPGGAYEHYTTAENLLTELAATEPENVTYHRLRGQVLATIANFHQGERRSRALRGYWEWLSGLDSGMVDRLEEVARFGRVRRQVLLWLSAELVEDGELAAARPVVERLVELYPEDEGVRALRARVSGGTGQGR